MGFAYVIDELLHPRACSNQDQAYCMVCDSYVSVQDLFLFRPGQEGRMRQVFLQFLKSNVTLLGPYEIFPLMKKLEKGSSTIGRWRNKPIQGYGHSSQPLHFFWFPRQVQIINGFDLVGVNFYPSIGDHVTQKLPRIDTEKTFRSIEYQKYTSQII